MAIIIPSRNIYEINNPKIRDNLIDNVSVEQTVVVPDNEYEVSVANQKIEFSNDEKVSKETKNEYLDRQQRTDAGGGYGSSTTIVYAFVSYSNQKTFSTQVKIPIVKDNKWISSIKTGTYTNETEEKENNIKTSLFGIIESGNATATISPTSSVDTDKIENLVLTIDETSSVKYFSLPLKIEETYTISLLTAKATQSLKDIGNISTVNYSIRTIDNQDYYVFDLIIFCDCRTIKLKGATGAHSSEPMPDANMVGEYENFIAKQVEITFYGNTIGIDLTNGSVTYGSGNKPHALRGNELLQDSGKVRYQDNTIVPIAEHLARNVLLEYKNGKETATLLCDINDYYNESGEKVIDANGDEMVFRLHDQVIPMVFGANGKDQPMSKYQDNSAKVFEVVGSKIFYDGAVWQELTLQEFSK